MMNLRSREALFAAAARSTTEKDYWLQEMNALPQKCCFPYDYFPVSGEEPLYQDYKCSLGKEVSERLLWLSYSSEEALQVYALSLVCLLLFRYGGYDEVVLGVPIYQQNRDNLINTCFPLRVHLRPDMTFQDLAERVKDRLLAGMAHQNYPLEVLADDLQRPAAMGEPCSLFDISVIIQGLQPAWYVQYLPHQLSFTFEVTPEGVAMTLRFNSRLYEPATIQSLVTAFLQLQKNVLFETGSPLATLPWNEKKEKVCPENTALHTDIPSLITAYAEKAPDAIAIVCEERQITYKTLVEKSRHIAAHIQRLSMPENTLVAVLLEDDVTTIIACIGIMMAGHAFVPLDGYDTLARQQAAIRDASPQYLVADRNLADRLEINIPVIWSEGIASGNTFIPVNESSLQRAACALYSSLGDMVLISQYALLLHSSHVMTTYYAGIQKVALAVTPACYLGITTLLPVLTGGRTLILSRKGYADTAFIELLTSCKPDLIRITGAQLALLYRQLPQDGLPRRIITLGNIPQRAGPALQLSAGNTTEILHEYSIAEAPGIVTMFKAGTGAGLPFNCPLQEHVTVRDTCCMEMPVGLKGNIYFSGDGLAIGYINTPQQTAATFKGTGANRYFISVDRGYYQDGSLFLYIGNEAPVTTGRYRYSVNEAENTIRNFPGVKEVVLCKDPRQPEALLAFVLSNDDPHVMHTTWENMAVQQLPPFMIPSAFIVVAEIPLTHKGLPDSSRLLLNRERNAGYESPCGRIEERVAQIWDELLKDNSSRISRDDDFFSLGGQSLKAIQMASRISGIFKVRISLVDILRVRTLKKIAALVEERGGIPVTGMMPAVRKLYYHTTSAQRKLYSLQQLQPTTTTYNMTQAYALRGGVDIPQLETAFRRLIERHEALRTSFEVINGELYQQIHASVDFNLQLLEVADGKDIHKLLQHTIRPFDLSRAPLISVTCITAGEQTWLIADAHHIISDGISHQLMARDLSGFYAGITPQPLKLHFKDYVEWLHTEGAKTLAAQEQFWCSEFSIPVTPLRLPLSFKRPALRDFKGQTISFEMDALLTERLRRLAMHEGVTLFVLVLSLYNILLARISGQEDLVVGIPVSDRQQVEMEPVVGCFVNTIALRSYPAAHKSLSAFMVEVNHRLQQALANQQYPIEELVYKLEHAGAKNRNALFDVTFSYNEAAEEENIDHLPDMQPLHIGNRHAKFDLTLHCLAYEEKLLLAFEYSTQLFDEHAVRQFIGYLLQLAHAVEEGGHLLLSDLQLSVTLNSLRENKDDKEIEFSF
ncbi:condensation domain-containing protein [Chitinophaga qingshengii]|uniref:AMP-binding protein n=1 Tax=Chitinophaga qingshengii TaxID=1569794 RepID=A0ABR7TFV2_9BACT|nr:condensation domain-containing protein [Chitinophaga qingshengii]MBC9929270.1 AMP-binding protein [Chitinophaga qingshengii]